MLWLASSMSLVLPTQWWFIRAGSKNSPNRRLSRTCTSKELVRRMPTMASTSSLVTPSSSISMTGSTTWRSR